MSLGITLPSLLALLFRLYRTFARRGAAYAH